MKNFKNFVTSFPKILPNWEYSNLKHYYYQEQWRFPKKKEIPLKEKNNYQLFIFLPRKASQVSTQVSFVSEVRCVLNSFDNISFCVEKIVTPKKESPGFITLLSLYSKKWHVSKRVDIKYIPIVKKSVIFLDGTILIIKYNKPHIFTISWICSSSFSILEILVKVPNG